MANEYGVRVGNLMGRVPGPNPALLPSTDWSCAYCDRLNPKDLRTCEGCGAPMKRRAPQLSRSQRMKLGPIELPPEPTNTYK